MPNNTLIDEARAFASTYGYAKKRIVKQSILSDVIKDMADFAEKHAAEQLRLQREQIAAELQELGPKLFAGTGLHGSINSNQYREYIKQLQEQK